MSVRLQRHKRDVAPVTNEEDRKIYFAVRKLFSGEDVDEKTHDTTSYSSPDTWAYLLMHGYRKEEDRFNYTVKEAETIIELRKKYDLGPIVVPEYWEPKWTFSIPLEEFQKEWPSCMYGRDRDGVPVAWDTFGSVSTSFLKRLKSTSDGWESAKHYLLTNMENLARVKMMMSNDAGYRITSHNSIIDVSNVGITTLGIVKEFFQSVAADFQRMYPEVAKRSYLVKSGWVFSACWTIIKQFLHPDTAAKVDVYGSDFKTRLGNEGISQIPSFVGGSCNDYRLGFDNIYSPGSKKLPLGITKPLSYLVDNKEKEALMEEQKSQLSISNDLIKRVY